MALGEIISKRSLRVLLTLAVSLCVACGRVEESPGVRNQEIFIYFSDPHLGAFANSFTPEDMQRLDECFVSMRQFYKLLPVEFCLCGGDWLNNRDTQIMAKQKLLYIDTKMREWFPRYYKIMGNHDNNYQGVVSESDSSRGDLPREFIDNEYYKGIGSAYFTFKGKRTLFIILDTGIDWQSSMDEYRKEQMEWLAGVLTANKEPHIVMGMHIFYNEFSNKIRTPMSKEVMGLISAFNGREVYESAYVKADFANAEGKVHFMLCGHNHTDWEYYENDFPCIGIRGYISEDQPSFDICTIDYDKGYLDMSRIGSGEDRHLKICQ